MLVKGGLFGEDDDSYLAMLLLQMLVIISLSRALVWLLSKIGQPSILGQILCGIILGPSVLGQIPGYYKHFFPGDSIENLYMISDFTVVLYIFLIGLELNTSSVFQPKRKYPLYIGFISVFFPFITGLGMSFIFKDEDNVNGTRHTITHMLYIGLVLAISALPVLSRIISELGLLQTVVGASSVSVITVDNLLCWGLLIIVSSFINSTADTLSPLYIFLSLMAVVIVMFFVIRPLTNIWIKHYESEIEQAGAVSEFTTSVIFILLLLSSWVTHRFGGHAVIGSFMFGLILPHGQFTVKITEKVEDVVVIFLLPLYIAVSGLRSTFDFFSDYMFWVWLVLLFVVSSFCKIVPASIIAKFCKFSWRESFSLGILLNTKGLMDLVVLNMGFDSQIISPKTYSLFILITLLTTFSTTPLISKVYSQKYRVPMALDAPINVEFTENTEMTNENDNHTVNDQSNYYKLLITITNTKSLPGLMTVLHLLNNKQIKGANNQRLMVHSLRVMEFSERSSSIQMATDATTTTNLDPISTILRTFGQLNNINIIANLIVAKPSDFASTISYYSENFRSNMLIIPFDYSETNIVGTAQSGYLTLANIFENPNNQSSTSIQQQQQQQQLQQQQQFNPAPSKTFRNIKSEYLPGICHLLKSSCCPVGIFIDRGFGQGPAMMALANNNNEINYANNVTNFSTINLYTQSVVIIFIGGPDDREALKLATRIAKTNKVQVVIKRIRQSSEMVKLSARDPTDIDYDIGPENLTFQNSFIKSTSLQTYQKMLSTLSERKSNNNSNRASVISDRKASNSLNKKDMNSNDYEKNINIGSATPRDESNTNNNDDDGANDNDRASKSSSGKNSFDSLSLLSKPSIAVSMSTSDASSSNSNSHEKLPDDKKEIMPPKIDTSLPSTRNNTQPSSKEVTPVSINMPDVQNQPPPPQQNNSNNKTAGLIKRGTLLGKIIRSRKNTADSNRQSVSSTKKGEENNEEEVKGSNESFSIEIEVDSYEDRIAFKEIKKLLSKPNSHISIEDVIINSKDQLIDACIDLVNSIGKKDLLIIGRESFISDNNEVKENDIANSRPNIELIRRKSETGTDISSNDPYDNTENNIQKTVSSFVASHFIGGGNSSNLNLQDEARLRTMAGPLGYRAIMECSASIMIVQASKYKGYDRTMEDITEMEEEKLEDKRERINSKSSLKKFNSFRDHMKLSTENIELRNLYKRSSSLRSGSRSIRSGSFHSNFRNGNSNSTMSIRNVEERQPSNSNINLTKDFDAKRKASIEEEEKRSTNSNKITFEKDNIIISNPSSSHGSYNNEINIMNNNGFSRYNTLSKKDEIERERIKQIIKDRESYLFNEIHNIEGDIASSDGFYIDSTDNLDNVSDSGL
ncbi:hypothetical protein BCR36DRAFT_416271 [Piromyces finnis]|uniref:Cation/H+ exchanger transmembrane domain-containing protein n=1 Tax=Piromyces finnis TaxID=1754191 RepID=A0A1Y1UY14_9FUNG|nr:hypothetical protein BCR36DRAFT_416271 [Piromyces finnis]|eukprot:ORX42141.1 hypothetical protein BCR36DRAFT_416271 [Piromyces finnis]